MLGLGKIEVIVITAFSLKNEQNNEKEPVLNTGSFIFYTAGELPVTSHHIRRGLSEA
jgi:hypothetical protein